MQTRKRPVKFYTLFLIPEGSQKTKKFQLSAQQLKILSYSLVGAVLMVSLNAVGFWYYRSSYQSLQKKYVSILSYESERKALSEKVALLEKIVGRTEMMAEKLASLVGEERKELKKGVGPILEKTPDVLATTLSLPHSVDLESEEIREVEDRVVHLQDKLKELTKVQENNLSFLASRPSLWPVRGWVTSDFGFRRSPFTRARDFHSGVDIAASWGTPIHSPGDGVVTYSGYRSGYGKTVVIDHGFGVVTRYGHTSQMFVHEGQRVKRGMKIALVGNTGHSTGPHLHYEIHVDGVPIDPMSYILH